LVRHYPASPAHSAWVHTECSRRPREAPLRLSNAAECVRFEKESFGALHQMLASLGEADQRAAWDEILEALGKYEGPEGFVGPCELVLAVGTR
jgi:hypothetical protein